MTGEFELIRDYFADIGGDLSGSVQLSVGDDCAVITPPAHQDLVVSIDTMVEGVHFPFGTSGDRVASRLLGAALSDLAAMAASPAFFTLALTLPDTDPVWLKAFSTRLAELARQYGVQLVGGDTTRGPLTLSVQVHGWTPAGKALLRSGARPGDRIFVTGTLGDSRGGLETLLNNIHGEQVPYLQHRFFCPEPRLDTALLIAPFATAAIDISDGLLADLNHILEASQVGAMLNPGELPISHELHHWVGEAQSRQWALSGGEDFELCFTAPALVEPKLAWALRDHNVAVTCIGQISETRGIVLAEDGQVLPVTPQGYNHFSGTGNLR
ncbi:thiamine-phosphate kinase [Amphritea atlantica]|jgi:thiamine-monophosphate kinase|uniref:Thiamine-monophosphate kinase n=1 Tax=Amphritea atlantica TaxID=355243 RepID=A0A1H9EU90_9GAMM|nr:thiamine-phosphate kinase [Amphritea atlantica]SEQ29209.1 thiamine-phosphate kinase [Amphritea atlantica]